jgi:hypothetical protein
VLYRIDGVAYGARIVFQDVNGGANSCPEPESFPSGSFATLLGDARGKGARIHSYSFGGGGTIGTPTAYDAAAAAIDGFLNTDANRDYMMFLAAGNNGSSTTNTAPSGRASSLSNESSSKNAVAVGANFSGNSAALQSRAGFSSIGPAPNGVSCSPQSDASHPAASNCGRIKPDLMAPGQDGNTGLAESYFCTSGDGNQNGPVTCLTFAGNSGTSFSTPNAAGSAALIRDYFVQGLYPDGTSGNASNGSDRVTRMSGQMVKALLVASAGDMNGGNLTNPGTVGIGGYGHRYNPEYGYGYVDLRNVLPLTNDPATPPGLIVHDAACPTGVACASNLSLPLSLVTGATASVEFNVLDTAHELRVALAWTDTSTAACTGRSRRQPGPGAALLRRRSELRHERGDIVYYGQRLHRGRQRRRHRGPEPRMAPSDDPSRYDRPLALRGILDPAEPREPRRVFPREAQKDAQNNHRGDLPLAGSRDGRYVHPRSTRRRAVLQLRQPAPHRQVACSRSSTRSVPNAVKYAVALAGPLAVDSSIRLDTNPITCNGDVAVVVNEVAKSSSVDGGCNSTNGCANAATISARTNVVVKTSAGTQVDQEIAPVLTKDATSLSFSSKRMPASTAANLNSDDDILVASDGYIVTATYNDQDCTLDGTAGCRPLLPSGAPDPVETIQRTSTATFDCTPNVDFFAIAQPGRNSVFLLAGGCDDDKFLDNRETFTYLVQFANLEDTLTLEDVEVSLRAVTPDADDATDAGRLNNAPSPYVFRRIEPRLDRRRGPGIPGVRGLQPHHQWGSRMAGPAGASPGSRARRGHHLHQGGKVLGDLRLLQAHPQRHPREIPLFDGLPDGRHG